MKSMNSDIEHTNGKIERELSNLVIYSRATKLKNFKFSQVYSTHDRCASIDDAKAEEFSKTKSNEFIKHTNLQLIRIYPNWKKQFSENYSPINAWAHGAQIGIFFILVLL